jgi:hypothetical protein
MRIINLIVAAALVLAAAHVYKSKFAATIEAERVAKLRAEIVRERDAIAALRAETAKLENPGRIQGLAERHLALKPLDPAQIATLDDVPFRPADPLAPMREEPVTARLKAAPATPPTAAPADIVTGGVRAPARAR